MARAASAASRAGRACSGRNTGKRKLIETWSWARASQACASFSWSQCRSKTTGVHREPWATRVVIVSCPKAHRIRAGSPTPRWTLVKSSTGICA